MSFSIPRGWSNVNGSNNVFFWHIPGEFPPDNTPIVLPEGDYQTFDEMATVVEQALRTVFDDTTTCAYDFGTRRYTITLGDFMADGTTP
eukprot:1577814-Pleurochrysis_carterae.AAC.1